MGSIKRLNSESDKVHLLFTNSGKAEIYVYDTLKKYCDASSESVYEVNNKKTFMEMLELSNMHPYLSRLWLFVIDYSKTKSLCKQYSKNLFQSDISRFMVKVNKYVDYKDFLTITGTVNDLYLMRLKYEDITYLLHKYKLPQKTLDFVAKTYANDVDKIFELKDILESGFEIQTPKQVVANIGTSGGTVSRFALQLLADPPKTEKGYKRVYKNRVESARMLIDAYGVKSLRNFLIGCVKDLLNIKTLYNQGIIFKQIRDLPEVTDEEGKPIFDEKRLSKYNYCLERITTEIPYQRILKLYCMLKESYWKSDEDCLRFLYNFYGGL